MRRRACIGIIGLYSFGEDPGSAWLGWFGIREGFRRRKLGSEALRKFEEMAADRGFRFARLYTDAVNNDAAIAFYKANGYICEPYENAEDPACAEHKTVILSKSLTSEPLALWNSRSIHLTEQIAKQERHRMPDFRSIRFTEQQLLWLYSLEWNMVRYDTANTEQEQAGLKEDWLDEWKEKVLATLGNRQTDCLIEDEDLLYATIREEAAKDGKPSWLYAFALELIRFTPYYSLDERKNTEN